MVDTDAKNSNRCGGTRCGCTFQPSITGSSTFAPPGLTATAKPGHRESNRLGLKGPAPTTEGYSQPRRRTPCHYPHSAEGTGER